MEKFKLQASCEKPVEIKDLREFDMQYFKELEGGDAWISLEQENCINQSYFSVYGDNGDRLGVVGVYDTEYEKNITHTVVDKKYRGQGLAAKFKHVLMKKLDLDFITMTISLENKASIKATEKLDGVKKVSDKKYEDDFNKVKYVYKKPKK